MARTIPLTCPTCGHQWQVDLDKYQSQQTLYKVYRGSQPKTKVETYYLPCPKDGTEVVAEVEIEE